MSNKITEFLSLKNQYDAESELMTELEKKPLSEGQVKDMMTRGFNDKDAAINLKRFNGLIDELRNRGLVVDDAPVSYSDFKKANPGVICLRQSTFYQMELEEFERFKNGVRGDSDDWFSNSESRSWKLYDDMPIEQEGQGDTEKVIHYKYNGTKYTGYGWRTITRLLHHPLTPEDQRKVVVANRLYEQARNEIDSIFKELGIDVMPNEDRGTGMTTYGMPGKVVV